MNRFDNDNIWNAENRNRVVVPKLSFHPDKVFIKTLSSGVDFLGWVHFSDHRVIRTATKKRMLRILKLKIETGDKEKIGLFLNSYKGMLKWGNTFGLEQEIVNMLE